MAKQEQVLIIDPPMELSFVGELRLLCFAPTNDPQARERMSGH